MTYGVVRAFQVIVNILESSPEKAGVGGSTPSLATIYSLLIINGLVQTANCHHTGRTHFVVSFLLASTQA
jgi:hypothetical protein